MTRLVVALVCLVVVACGGNEGTAATPKPKPKPVRVAEPGALAIAPDGALMVADRALNRVVRVDPRTKRRRVVVGGFRDTIVGLAYDDMSRLYVGAAGRIYRLDGTRKVVVAGTGDRAHTGDGGPATSAALAGPVGFEVDHDERIVIAEYDNWVRAVEPDGTIGTLAGTGESGYAGDGGPARAALVNHPHDVLLRRDRAFVIADSHNGVLRHVDPAGTITTLAQGLQGPIVAEGGPLDTIYVADANARTVYRFDANGQGRVVVARGVSAIGLAVDSRRNVYVAELTGRVLRVAPNGRRTVLVAQAR